MNQTNLQNAEKALKITMLLTLIVAGYEVFCSCQNYKTGMNFLDIASYANADLNIYCSVLILANLILLPSAILLYKRSGISLKEEIFDKSSISKDVVLGIVLAVISSVISLFSLVVMKGRSDLAFGGIAPTYHIELLERPTIVWDFHSLLLGVQMMFSFMLTDEKSSLKVCKYCGKAFVASRPNSVFCSGKCKNRYNVYKSRAKDKNSIN